MKFKIAKKKEMLYQIAIIMFLIWSSVLIGIKWKTNLLPLMNAIGTFFMYGIVLILLYCIFINKKLIKNYFILLLIMLITSIIIYFKNDDNGILFIVLFVFGIKDFDYERIIKCFAITQLISVIVILLTYYLGFSDNVISYFAYGIGHSLGTYHANNLGTIVFSGYLALCYAFLKKKVIIQAMFALIVAVFLWKITLSRTNCLLILLFPIVQLVIIMIQKTNKLVLLKLAKNIIITLFLIAIFLTLLYDKISTIYNDGTFLERFRFGALLFKQHGIHLFGSNIHFVSTVDARTQGISNLVLDSAYLKLIVNYGIIATIFVISIFSKVVGITIKNKNYSLLIVCLLIAVSGIMQAMLISVYNFALLAAFANNYKSSRMAGISGQNSVINCNREYK